MFGHEKAMIILFLFTFLFSLASSQAYDFGVDVSHLTRRDDPKAPIVVRRLPTRANATIPLRLEIRQMRANIYKWDLFILAMSMFQYADQDDPLSYYQVAGIHGVPFVTWNGVEPVSGTNQSGYCTHNSVLFPTWHRPYLTLYEQQMYKMANEIASMFTNITQRRLYQQAASDFRIPYWDWSLMAPDGDTHFPEVFWSPIILQNGPFGFQNIRNPLYSYQFHPLNKEALIWNPLKQWNETKRAPNTTFSYTAPISNNEEVNNVLLSKLPEIQQRLYILFSKYHDFNSFSNKAWAASQGLTSLDSVESIHDVIHIYGGSQGHMTYVPLSSFDPLFLLHHAMTDRLVAMWQILNPNAWITPMPAGETSYTTLKGTIQSSDSPLTPFFASENGTFWTSDMSRSTEAFGYAYADTILPHGSRQDLRELLVRKINTWYGSVSPIGLMDKAEASGFDQQAGKGHDQSGVLASSFRPNIRYDAQVPPTSRIVQHDQYTEWTANVQVKAGALNGSFTVHLFIGTPPKDASSWHNAPNLIGTVAIFAMRRMTESQYRIAGAVPLTSSILQMVAAGKVADLSLEAVQPFLRSMLHFAVQSGDKQRVSPSMVDGLYVSVTSSLVQISKRKTELPAWGPSVTRLELWT